MASDEVLSEQIAYYRARAAEYDATSYGDVPAAELRIDRVVGSLAPEGRVLELACGTGMWTRALAAHAAYLLAVDASPEAIAIARRRCPESVEFALGDLFAWAPVGQFDLVFFACWLSHVPSERVPEFFARVRSWLRPGGRVAFVDEPSWQAAKEPHLDPVAETVERTLRDGSTHRLVKVYLDPDPLAARLGALGWSATVDRDGDDWLVGTLRPAPSGDS